LTIHSGECGGEEAKLLNEECLIIDEDKITNVENVSRENKDEL
jgi:hypothetical protein